MQSESDTLTIESSRTGWRPTHLASVCFILVWCVVWYRQGAGSGGVALLFLCIGLAIGTGTLAMSVNHAYAQWRLEVRPDVVMADRRGPLKSRRWTCRREEFLVGEIATVKADQDGTPLFTVRFVDLRFSGNLVQFMEGHDERDLSAVRSRILAWTGQATAA